MALPRPAQMEQVKHTQCRSTDLKITTAAKVNSDPSTRF